MREEGVEVGLVRIDGDGENKWEEIFERVRRWVIQANMGGFEELRCEGLSDGHEVVSKRSDPYAYAHRFTPSSVRVFASTIFSQPWQRSFPPQPQFEFFEKSSHRDESISR